MKSNTSLLYGLVLIVGDFLALLGAFAGAYVLRVSIDHRPIAHNIHASTYLGVFLLLLPFWILVFGLMGLYGEGVQEKRFTEASRLAIGSFIGLIFVTSLAYFYNHPIFPAKLVPVYGFVFAFFFLLAFRNLARAIRARLYRLNIGVTNVLIVGNTRIAKELTELLADYRISGYRIVGIVSDHPKHAGRYPDIPVFETFAKATKKIRLNDIHGIVQTELFADADQNDEILDFAHKNHVSYRFVPGNSELFVGNIDVELFRSQIPVIAVHQTALLGWGRIVKRLFDAIASGLAIIIFSPFFLAIFAILVVAGGDPIYKRHRLTRFGATFTIYKFRSLKRAYNGIDPEEGFAKMGRPELAREFRANGDFLVDDPRISRFGRFIRGSSLDELPQLFNVFKGDISLVGPRALIPEELSTYEKRHAILSVKSGLTSLAVVSGRKDIPFEERRRLDLYYVQNWSLWMDIMIIVKTFRVIFHGRGAA